MSTLESYYIGVDVYALSQLAYDGTVADSLTFRNGMTAEQDQPELLSFLPPEKS